MADGTEALVLWRKANSLLTLEDLATAASLQPKRVETLVGVGLLEPSAATGSGPLFPVSSIERLQRIGRLRRDLGVNLAGIAVILDMRERIEALQSDMRHLRRCLGEFE